ncbi:SRPBCC family protein [Mangrovivirga sp. M17]|uniref:SRPBCC family protein n=1 Tax=Mangrovivirga halotolerans TaxID=2993936 RepID=A0ABT3RKY5_9BACT|nr:SRPBCC family protein [Mangrovivirga halotolerans]MCX2742460.1 SRPBCC family protein [Mangrovivirga halotolerans]
MKVLKITGFVFLAIVLALFLTIAFAPSHVKLERIVAVKATPEEIYPHISDLKKFNEWSPWYKLDPDAVYSFIGSGNGIGSIMKWESKKRDVGNGQMEIIEIKPNESVTMEMYFGQDDVPAYATLALLPINATETEVSWNFESEMTGFSKLFGLMMETMLGPSYEEGLNNLKNTVEAK